MKRTRLSRFSEISAPKIRFRCRNFSEKLTTASWTWLFTLETWATI